jgi:hypothetical protein
MEATAKVMADLDVYLAPQSKIDDAFVSTNLRRWLTNLTGHPAVVVPNGFARAGNLQESRSSAIFTARGNCSRWLKPIRTRPN